MAVDTTSPRRTPSKRGAGADPANTRRRLLGAALTTLRTEGYAGATARAIAAAAGCNQASIYYHFGGIEPLLVAALLDSTERRFERYRSAIDPLDDIGAVLGEWRRLHDEDIASGHITVLTELIGATGAQAGLRDGVRDSAAMWTAFIEETIERVARTSPLTALLPPQEAASAIFALFLGIELMTHLDGDTERAGRLFALGDRLAVLLAGGR